MKFFKQLIKFIKVMIFPPKRGRMDTDYLGLNAFFNERKAGTIVQQSDEIFQELGIEFIRVLFHYNEAIQPEQSMEYNFSFYDEIIDSIPTECEVLIVITGAPKWLESKTAYEARSHFLKYCKAVIDRYSVFKDITVDFQIGNEPNSDAFEENVIYDFLEPKNYVVFVSMIWHYMTGKGITNRIVGAATTSIIQNYPDTLDYNEDLIECGLLDYIDVYAVHYYGDSFVNLVRPGGALYFIQDLGNIPIRFTEIGTTGHQLEYAERVIPFLLGELSKNVDGFYWYKYASDYSVDKYGMRVYDGEMERLSTLWSWLIVNSNTPSNK